jgi:hypothetical protein
MTANFHPGGDIGYVKKALSHYVENAPETQILARGGLQDGSG